MTALDDTTLDNTALRGALDACRESPEAAATLPPACYTDPSIYEIEQQTIFGSGWVGVGRADRWALSGDYSAIELGGVPVLIVRDDTGGLRAYANSCRHRGSQILVGDGSCTRLRCPFHFWTYGLDGRLIGAPSMQRTLHFDRSDHGLIEFALAERHGFVFVSFEDEPPAIDEWLGDFAQVHTPWPLAELVTARRRTFRVNCNWKAFAEVFNEYYHLPYVHPDSIDDTYNEPDEPEAVTGAYATHFGTTTGTGGLLEDDRLHELPRLPNLGEREAHGVRYTWLFPNTMIALGVEGMWMYEVYPDGPDHCQCAQVVCFPRSTVQRRDFDDKAAAYYERFDVAIAEDIPMLEQQHRGLASRFAQPGRFSHLEPSVARFASWYAEQLLAAPRASASR